MNKTRFQGGIRNQFVSEKEDLESSYRLLINARVRDDAVRPIQMPVEDTSLPAGLAQGAYAFDRYILVFISGAAYYKALGATAWTKIEGLTMTATAERIYVERIPASTVNFKRKGETGGLDFTAPVGQSQSALICMDGARPHFIFPDGGARAANTWNQWTDVNREYIPNGKFPLFVNNKLYCVIQDANGRWTQIVGSVSGRPADFVILVNEAGGKAGASETDYGAPALAYSVSYDELTALARTNTADRAFLATTNGGSYLVIPDYTNTIRAEPTYGNQQLFTIGALGPETITDLNGDTAVMYKGGVRTFNGVAQLKWEGRNAPLMRNIQALVGDILQSYGATVQFNNYVGFALQTIYGAGIIWWDDTLGNFVALDIYPGAARIKQLAAINTASEQELYFITFDNRLFRAFAGVTAEAAIRLHDISQDDAGGTLIVNSVTPSFIPGSADGFVTTTLYTDEAVIEGKTRALVAGHTAAPRLLVNPYNAIRSGVELRWTGGGALTRVTMEISPYSGNEVEPFSTDTADASEQTFIFLGDDGVLNASRTAVYTAIVKERGVTAVIGLGDHIYETGTQAEVDANMAPYWERFRAAGRFFAVPGDRDNDTGAGTAFFQYVRQNPTRYSVISFDHTDVFLFDTGYKIDGTQVNPDNLTGASIDVSAQANWLVTQLKASTKRNKIVVWHHPAYTSGATYGPGKTELRPLLRRVIDAGATAHINSHSRIYERIVDEIPQFTVGTGGAALHSIGTRAAGSAVALATNATYGYLRARISPLRAVFEFCDIGGNVLDKFVA